MYYSYHMQSKCYNHSLLQHCDKVIGGYTEMSKMRERSHVLAEIVDNGVAILSNSKKSGSLIRFDRNPPKVLRIASYTL